MTIATALSAGTFQVQADFCDQNQIFYASYTKQPIPSQALVFVFWAEMNTWKFSLECVLQIFEQKEAFIKFNICWAI